MENRKLEIACFNSESAIVASTSGADRIELCDNMKVGGTTPLLETFQVVKNKSSKDVFVMIRPRGGNFVYNNEEFLRMKRDVEIFKKSGANGFVFGILTPDYMINKIQNRELVELAAPLPCTFHRAFDETKNWAQSLEDVIDCGFKTILTSGLHSNAMEGIAMLAQLKDRAGERINIMPGGGVRANNIAELIKTGFVYYHSAAIIDNTLVADGNEIRSLKEKLK